MCRNDIEITIKIPCKPNELDVNDVAYSELALQQLAQSMAGQPLTANESADVAASKSAIIGFITHAEYDGEAIIATGRILEGGTSESVKMDTVQDKRTVVSASCFGVGFSVPCRRRDGK